MKKFALGCFTGWIVTSISYVAIMAYDEEAGDNWMKNYDRLYKRHFGN